MAKHRLRSSFSARTALIGLEIRQDSRVQSPCLAKKSAPIQHPANFQTRPNLLKPPHKANRYGKPVCPTEFFLSCSADGQIPFYIVLFSKNTVYLTYFARSAVPSNSPVRRTLKYKEQSLGKPFLANLLLTGYMSTVSESCEHSCSEYSRYKSVPEDR